MLFLHGECQPLLLKCLLGSYKNILAVFRGPFSFLSHVTLPSLSNSFNYLLVSQQSSGKCCFGYYLVPYILPRGIEKFRNNAAVETRGGNYTNYKILILLLVVFFIHM